MTTKNYLQQYISQKVKYFRTQNKMSQEELSEQAGLGLKYINQLENQNVNLTIHSLEKVIDILKPESCLFRKFFLAHFILCSKIFHFLGNILL